MKKKITYILIFCAFVLAFLLFILLTEAKNAGEKPTEETEKEPVSIAIETIDMQRISRREIQISWSDELDAIVDTYVVKKRNVMENEGIGEWNIIGTINSDKAINENEWYIIDELTSEEPQQYEYRVDVELSETENYVAQEGKAILGSNVMICIDPGHYDIAREVAEADSYHYVEGNFVLEVALELKKVLKEEYGIDACMTRDTGTITLNGYSDEELDSAHISLRGEFAAEEDSDLFVSLHTNSNEEEANGYPTYFQPIEINKPIIIINSVAKTSDIALKAANSIGTNLAKINYQLNLAVLDDFKTVETGAIEEWTKVYNDGLNEIGTILCRTGSKGDYYGILRGAGNVEVPGLIIEHGFHSVPEVRKEAAEGELAKLWAEADAYGIAYGFGFVEKNTKSP